MQAVRYSSEDAASIMEYVQQVQRLISCSV